MILARACPHCRSDNLPHRRYCRECGAPLELRCPGCGFANLVGDVYCGGCGESLDGVVQSTWHPESAAGGRFALPSALAGADGALAVDLITAAENRLATIVKADLSGFTAMSELLGDPEEVTVIMNQVFDPLVACVRRYEGYIDNYAGDMIISFFGTPNALEDGAERAVRAALEMRDEVARLNDRNISHGVDLGISTGIATGYGLWSDVGAGVSSKKTISGELGDYAALLEKYAERGTVGVCPDTYDRIAHVIPGEMQEGKVHRPGEEEELPIYFAGLPHTRECWLTEAAQDAVELCGRQELLDELAGIWAEAKESGGALLLCGEPGSGKSRLLLELARRVMDDGHCVCAAGARPLSEALGDEWERDLRHSMLTSAGIDPNDNAARTGWLNSLGLKPRNADVDQWLVAAAKQRSYLLIIDGLDWLTGDLSFVRELADSRVLVAMAARTPAALADVGLSPDDVTVIDLPPLAREPALELAGRRLGAAVPNGAAEWLWRWADGNPRYVESFAGLIPDLGGAEAITAETAFRWLPWRVQEHSDIALDALSATCRAVLQVAAVACDDGLAFTPGLIGYLINAPSWSAELTSLVAAGHLTELDGGRLAFRHRALWRACRARMVDSVRQQLAERADQGAAILADA